MEREAHDVGEGSDADVANHDYCHYCYNVHN